jgi:hypothetical protein
MRKHPYLFFLGSIAIGTLISILLSPKGKEFRRSISDSEEEDDEYWDGIDTFNISELTAEGSASLEQIRQKIEAEK